MTEIERVEMTTQADEVGWLTGWPRWCPTSITELQDAETKLLANVKTPYTGKYINIGNNVGNTPNEIWTIALNESSSNEPLVLVHGFGSGIGLWTYNLDALARDRPVYAFDILGFGRSSRPTFASDSLEAESQLVDSIEDWRIKMNIEKFILLGHSFGGYLVTAYALKCPNNVHQLILADPWGFSKLLTRKKRRPTPMWKTAVAAVLKPFNPFVPLRIAGPWGPNLIEKFMPDLGNTFSSMTDSATESNDAINYLYHCNVQTPSGEAAFNAISGLFGWAKRPMIDRIGELRHDLPLSIIYGSRTFIDHQPGFQIKQEREFHVDVEVIPDAGHILFADQPNIFNNLVINICNELVVT